MTATAQELDRGTTPEQGTASRAEEWSTLEAWSVRVALIYAAGSAGSLIMGGLHIPGWNTLFQWIDWPAEQLLKLIPASEYRQIFSSRFVPSLLLGAVWVLVDRWRRNEPALRETARLLCSYALGTQILVYALVKIFVSMWPAGLNPPSVGSIFQVFGEVTGGSFFWWWIGVSPIYRTFTGAVELIGALMMFNRRTQLMGTLLNAVVLLNISYMMHGITANPLLGTIPMSRAPFVLFLLWNDRKRLGDLFVRDLRFIPAPAHFRPSKPWMRKALIAFTVLYFARTAIVDWEAVVVSAGGTSSYGGPKRARPTFHYLRNRMEGLYEVVSYERNGSPVLSAEDAPRRWRQVVINRCRASARTLDEVSVFFWLGRAAGEGESTPNCSDLDIEPVGRDLRWWSPAEIPKDTLRYRMPAPDLVTIEGSLGGVPVTASLRRVPDERFPLYDRRWWRTR